MIPVQLTIKGLYSYVQSVSIDFDPLVSARLFGIFGPVGSGKSTILEAIMFVLFDRSTRLNKAGDDRYYNMMNLQSNEMSIDFIFRGGRNHQNKYRFYFLARRSAKDFQKVEVKDRSYYQWSKNDWRPLSNSDVLGMTYENFMQTVIIPQGKFREFIDQKPAARTQMLKELFNLDRFDIAAKAFHLLGLVKNQHSYLDGQLSQFQDIDKNLLKQLVKEIAKLTAETEKKTAAEAELIQQTNKLQVLQHLYQEFSEVDERLTTLLSEQDFYQRKQHQLNRFLRVQQVFKSKVLRQVDLLEEAKSKQADLQQAIETVGKLTGEVANLEKQWKQAQQEFATKDRLQQQINDLNLLITLRDQQSDLDTVMGQHDQVTKSLVNLDQKLKDLESLVEESRNVSSKKSEALLKKQQLTELQNWWAIHTDKDNQCQALHREQTDIQGEITSLNEERKQLLSTPKKIEVYKQEILKARKELQALLVQDDWRTHARHLEQGKPCPLCGSLNHPTPLSTTDLARQIRDARSGLETLEQTYEQARQREQQASIVATRIEGRQRALENLNQKYQLATRELDRHRKNYPEQKRPQKPPGNLERRIEELNQSIKLAETELGSLPVRLEQLKKLTIQRDALSEQLAGITTAKEQITGRVEHMAGTINTVDQKRLSDKTKAQLRTMSDQIKASLTGIDQNYQQVFDQLSKAQKSLNQQEGNLQSLETQVTQIKTQLDQLESSLVKDCKKESFKGLKEVRKVLELGLDVEQEQNEIQKYRTDLNTSRERHRSLQNKMGKDRYDAIRHRQLNDRLDDTKMELKQLNHQLSHKKLTHDQYVTRLQKKDELEKELKELSVRKDNTQEICNLLRGNGFINFISSVYLQNLCKTANTRFTRLTGNRLSLELNQQNEFVVRDYLNNGKLRLLKTLSGGQIFQASLSLALSLAENVKKLNQAEQSFFFLDEGFGALDRNSLQLVFETLKTLPKENRIVGIISHVEDLQTEIDTYIEVRQDSQLGSIARCSWE